MFYSELRAKEGYIEYNTGEDDKWEALEYLPTPNAGGNLSPTFIVMHYTAGPSMTSAMRSLTDRNRKASAHFIIDTDGKTIQLLSTDKVAWHAGRSKWKDLSRMNLHSIGIELVNAGKLLKALTLDHGPVYKTWWGKLVGKEEVHEPDDYFIPSKYKGQSIHKIGQAFEAYPQEQLETAFELCRALREAYPDIEDILGHSDVAVPAGRKIDPGPAFPMEEFRAALFDRCDEEDYDVGNS